MKRQCLCESLFCKNLYFYLIYAGIQNSIYLGLSQLFILWYEEVLCRLLCHKIYPKVVVYRLDWSSHVIFRAFPRIFLLPLPTLRFCPRLRPGAFLLPECSSMSSIIFWDLAGVPLPVWLSFCEVAALLTSQLWYIKPLSSERHLLLLPSCLFPSDRLSRLTVTISMSLKARSELSERGSSVSDRRNQFWSLSIQWYLLSEWSIWGLHQPIAAVASGLLLWNYPQASPHLNFELASHHERPAPTSQLVVF